MPTKYLENLTVGSEVGVQIHGYITIKPFLYFSPSGGNTQFYEENSFCISQSFESDCAPLNGQYHIHDISGVPRNFFGGGGLFNKFS